MFDLVGERTAGFDLNAAVSLPIWLFVLIAVLVGLVCTSIASRGGMESRASRALHVALVLLLAITGAWALDHLAARDLANERRSINERAFELRMRALMPGSPLGCLDAAAGEAVDEACEKVLFASPEATASAVSYVTAQVSLL